MRVVYIAHPYGGSVFNRERAKRWFRWAAVHQRVSPVADWIIMTELLDETNREFGLECDVALVRLCHETWLVGGHVSPGMHVEAKHAAFVRDLTSLGPEPPEGPVDVSAVHAFSPLAFKVEQGKQSSRQMNLGDNAIGRVVHYYSGYDGELAGPFAAIIVEVVDGAEGRVCLALFKRGGTEWFTADFSEEPRVFHWTWRRDG